MEATTAFECRGCGKYMPGTVDGPIESGCGEILHIDGPRHVCPDCLGKEEVLMPYWLDGYINAEFAPCEATSNG